MRFSVENSGVDLGELGATPAIGDGGAGVVYLHPALPNQCIKIYKIERDPKTGNIKDRAAAHELKVRAMLERAPDQVVAKNGTVQMAWPRAAVIDESGKFRGFVMPFIDFNESWGMSAVQNATVRQVKGIREDLVFRLTAAINLCYLIDSLHRAGHFVVDLKPPNVRIYGQSGFVALIDCDGFSISEGAGRPNHPAALSTPEYSHPNGISSSGGPELSWVNQNPREQDLWALAYLTFELLSGDSPFRGHASKSFHDYPTALIPRIKRHRECYANGVVPNPRVTAVSDSPHPWFSPALRRLFDKAFIGNSGMPSAMDWRNVLIRFQDEKYRCLQDPVHWKLGDFCGQCELEKRAGITMQVHGQVAAPMPRSTATGLRLPSSSPTVARQNALQAPRSAPPASSRPSAALPSRPSPHPPVSKPEVPPALIAVGLAIAAVLYLAIFMVDRNGPAEASAAQDTLVAATPVVTPVTEWTAWVAPGNEINVRSGPGLDHPIVSTETGDSPIVTTGGAKDAKGQNWQEVRLSSGSRGFIATWVANKSLTYSDPNVASSFAPENMPAAGSSADSGEHNPDYNYPRPDREGSVDPAWLGVLPPRYPQDELRRGVQGTSILIVSIDAGGNVQDVSIERSSGNRNLDREAVRTARSWPFNPAISNGQPVASRVRVPIQFKLTDYQAQAPVAQHPAWDSSLDGRIQDEDQGQRVAQFPVWDSSGNDGVIRNDDHGQRVVKRPAWDSSRNGSMQNQDRSPTRVVEASSRKSRYMDADGCMHEADGRIVTGFKRDCDTKP